MIGEPINLTVRKTFDRPSTEDIDLLRNLSTGFVVDAQNGTGGLGHRIKPLENNMRFIGPAITAETAPRDYLPVQPAIALSKPGDVLVIATSNYEGAAVIGDNVAAMAKNSKLAAIITDGLVRDVDGILEVDIPVFCVGVSPNSPYANGPGTVGLPVAISGRVIEPGDIIIGDINGIVTVPRKAVSEIIAQLEIIKELEKDLESKVKNGLCYAPWVDAYLASDTTKFID